MTARASRLIVEYYATPDTRLAWQAFDSQQVSDKDVFSAWNRTKIAIHLVAETLFKAAPLPPLPFSQKLAEEAVKEGQALARHRNFFRIDNVHEAPNHAFYFQCWAEQKPQDRSREAIVSALSRSRGKLKTFNLSYPIIVQPKFPLFDEWIQKYQGKYKIDLRSFLLDSNLKAELSWLLLNHPESGYIGIFIVNYPHPHVVPLLIYLGPSQPNRHVEFMILDSDGVGKDGKLVHPFARETKNVVLSLSPHFEAHIFANAPLNQYDCYSCRIAALAGVRNTLLSLRATGARGFREAFQKANVRIGRYNEVVPPLEWSYTNQIVPKNKDGDSALAIRDQFSAKPEKRRIPRSVTQFRDQYTESVLLKCTLQIAKQADREATRVALEAIPSKQGIVIENSLESMTVTFYIAREVNTYVQRKLLRKEISTKDSTADVAKATEEDDVVPTDDDSEWIGFLTGKK